MLTEIGLVVAALLGAFAAGLTSILVQHLSDRRRHRTLAGDCGTEWKRHSPELARNLLVLETVADEIESTPIDVAVRARLTPAEMNQATSELAEAGLVEKPSQNLVRLTETGREVLARHKFELEESSLQRRPRSSRKGRDLAELDTAIEHAVAALRTAH